MDPPSGLPDPSLRVVKEMQKEDLHSQPRRGNLTPETSEREGLGRELLETKKVNLIPWGGALSRMGVVVHSLPVPLGAGRAEVSEWWESPGGLGFLPGFTCRILPKDLPCP